MSEPLDVDEAADPEPEAPKASPKKAAPVTPVAPPVLHGRNGHDDELHLVASVMLDPAVLYPRAAHLPPEAFQGEVYRSLWRCFEQGMAWPDDLPRIVKATKAPAAALFDIARAVPTEAGFSGYLSTVEEAYRGRRFTELVAEMSRTINPDPGLWAKRLEELVRPGKEPDAEGLGAYDIPEDSDNSVLLGDRYLNRGDGAVISGPSGMGKSSLSRQMMAHWALARPFYGMKCNGPLRSLEIQAEDSRGDIGEVRRSIEHGMKLSAEECSQVNERVLIVTERVRRGQPFLDRLARLIAKHKPDLVWINPLQAFIEGDVTEARDLGDFLRAGLNRLNGDHPTFGYVLVHHTTKPATGKEKTERLWHEVMYDMAGGAEIINWARAIISLRASGEPGDFNMVLAKRGIRAGVTKEVEQGAGVRDEPVTTIPLRWTKEQIDVPGRTKKLKSLFWESRTAAPEEEKKSKRGAPRGYAFADFRASFPKNQEGAAGFRRIHAIAKDIKPVGVSAFYNIINDALEADQLATVNDERGRPKYWLKHP